MGKTQEETMNNPFIPQDSKLHALTRAEEENCYKDMKAKALEYCQLPIKGTTTTTWTEKIKIKNINKSIKKKIL